MDNENNTSCPIVKEVLIDSYPHIVWKAITDKDEMQHWYFTFDAFSPTPAFQFQFTGGSQYLHLCTVKEAVPNSKLSYTWEYESIPGASSLVTFELFGENGKTRVRLTHEGIESFSSGGSNFTRESFSAGWNDLICNKLKAYVEKPRFYIEKSVEINTSSRRVWEVLTDLELIKKWACGFGEGMHAESTWEKGSEVLWKGKDGTVCIKGVVAVNEPLKVLRVNFYECMGEDMKECSGEVGSYSETFELEEKEGKVKLNAVAGTLSGKHVEILNPLWDKAMPLIKELAEN